MVAFCTERLVKTSFASLPRGVCKAALLIRLSTFGAAINQYSASTTANPPPSSGLPIATHRRKGESRVSLHGVQRPKGNWRLSKRARF
jgi:hypothetical protein